MILIEGVTIERIAEDYSRFRIQGYAADNTIVAAYLRRLHETVDTPPSLDVVTQRQEDGLTVAAFSISVRK